MKKRIFLTGAAGFIGFHLAKKLHARGDDVIGFDNFNDYYDPSLKHRRKAELNKLGIKIIEGDITNKEYLQKRVKDYQPTHILNMAAQAGVRYSLQNPHAYIKSNVDGFLNILEICRENPSCKLVYASSSSVYGLNQKIPFSEEDRTDHQASLYGVTKKTNELMAYTYHHLFGISAVGLRFFTVYGPWGRPDMAYFLFTKAILEGRPIQVYHQGQMSRDFTYIDDIVDGVLAALDGDFGCEIFNLGNHHPESLMDMIAILEKELGLSAKKEFLPLQDGDVISTYADIKNSAEKLGFRPKVPLQQGLAHFVSWYKENLV